MKTKSTEILLKYNHALRLIVDENVQRLPSPATKARITKKLRLADENDFDFLISAFYAFEDTMYAIENFIRFKIDGPTRYDDLGEKYLRLYGFLNAVYLQQKSILELLRIFQISTPKKNADKYNKLKLTEVRHKIGSHSVNYKNTDGKKETYLISQITMTTSKINYSSNSNNVESVDLLILLNDYLKCTMEDMDRMLEQVILRFYKTSKEKKAKWIEKLNDLRVEKDGGFVAPAQNATDKLVITFTP